MYQDLIDRVAYDPATGLFTWKKGPRAGLPALGTLRKDGYLWGKVNGKYWLANRAAWVIHTGKLPVYDVDHEDGNRANNVFTNLRDVPESVNCKNRSANKNPRQLPPGVSRRPGNASKPYVARLGKGGKVLLGTFATAEEASAAYQQGLVIHGYSDRHGK